jgi:hypothetical protein
MKISSQTICMIKGIYQKVADINMTNSQSVAEPGLKLINRGTLPVTDEIAGISFSP